MDLEAGEVEFTFVSASGCREDGSVTVIIDPLPAIDISNDNFSLCIGSSNQMVANSSGSWSSSNTDVATIDDNGLITAISQGEVTISFEDLVTGCVRIHL